jgi:hypothetical protein
MMLLTNHWYIAGFVALLALLMVAAWHAKEPQSA